MGCAQRDDTPPADRLPAREAPPSPACGTSQAALPYTAHRRARWHAAAAPYTQALNWSFNQPAGPTKLPASRLLQKQPHPEASTSYTQKRCELKVAPPGK
ncbi:hypothetical protein NDU88_004466 [Pleurodeles waltl]|uniref:Uncharacterized protein n=1 Tax=Pleurodeles waltl TaxID=8319 RepID=A0AAV7NJJ2_PLEWA|nr:hypothetical protein NDU88_004466 [Pleurodeles waltl]